MNKRLTLILGILVVVIVLLAVLSQQFTNVTPAQEQVACTQETMICPDGSEVGRTGPNCEFAACPTAYGGEAVNTADAKHSFIWAFTKQGEDEATGVPKTKVSLIADQKEYQLGTFDGSCAEIDGSNWILMEGEKTGVICWWAGGGDELGVFQENGKFVVKKGIVEEGTAESEGVRGNFVTHTVLN